MDLFEMMRMASEQAKEEKAAKILATKPLATVTEDEAKQYTDVNDRMEAFLAGAKRASDKAEFDRKKWWVTMEEKYALYGKSLHFDAATRGLYLNED